MIKPKLVAPETKAELFDPLAVEKIGVILGAELVRQQLHPLPPEPFQCAGVYVLYYGGASPAYRGHPARPERRVGGPALPLHDPGIRRRHHR